MPPLFILAIWPEWKPLVMQVLSKLSSIDFDFSSSVSIRWLWFLWRPASSTRHVPSVWAPETLTAAGVSCTTRELCLLRLPLPLLWSSRGSRGIKAARCSQPKKNSFRKLPTCQNPVCVLDLFRFNVARRLTLARASFNCCERRTEGGYWTARALLALFYSRSFSRVSTRTLCWRSTPLPHRLRLMSRASMERLKRFTRVLQDCESKSSG